MKNYVLEAIIVGAGHAGLSASYYLTKYGMNHIVLERGKIGESWRSQRWDSFVLNSPNSINVLPGDDAGNDPGGFSTGAEFVTTLENYVSKFQLPVMEQIKVISVEKRAGEQFFTVTVSANGVFKCYQAMQVIICSGKQNIRKTPALEGMLPAGIKQLHTGEYRNAAQLPGGAVLVIGSAQSGVQIAEDLAGSGRKTYLSTSMVPRVPRRYRGKDIMDWLIATKFLDVRPTEVTEPKMLHMSAPQLTGTGGGRNTISLQSLSKKGVIILGKLENADGNNLLFQPDAAMHAQFADGFSKMVKGMIDEYILKNELDAPAAEEDIADVPDMDAHFVSSITAFNLKDHNISSIIWATGFSAEFNYIKLPVLDHEGNPQHENGLSGIEGLYFLGLPWLRARKSGLIYGIKDDAEFISERVYEYSREYRLKASA
jgi:putative flavoprotein involved in K+ transport